MNKRQIIYLILAIAGGLSTWYFNIQFMMEAGFDNPMAFIDAAMVNAASSSLTMDIGIAAVTGFTWMLVESRRLQMKNVWIYIVTGCFIAFAFAFPLFLFVRENYLKQESAAA